MSGFIAHLPPERSPADSIGNDGFFPSIDTQAVRAIARLDGTCTPAMLRDAIVRGIVHVNSELRTWAAEQQLRGLASLADVPSAQIGGQSARTHAYMAAITHAAMAHLQSAHRSQATLPAGVGKEARVLESVATREADHWQTVRHCIADVKGQMREHVGLI